MPYSGNNITFAVSGAGTYIAGGNGDPSCHVADKSVWRPAFHGLPLGVVQAGDASGAITVNTSADNLQPVTLTLPVSVPPAGLKA
jgi:beta-galactosidase